MGETRSRKVLTAIHLSSNISYKRAKRLTVNSSRRNPIPAAPVPGASPQKILPAEHAIVSFLYSSAPSGDILVRVIENGVVLELSTLQRSIDPLRVHFPSPILGAPVLNQWHNQLRILLVTEGASLFRLAFATGPKLWQEPRQPNKWCQEYLLRTSGLAGPVGSLGCDSLVVGLRNGGVLMVEAQTIGDADVLDDDWLESILPTGRLLGTLSQYMPFHSSSNDRIVSLALPPYSRDRSIFFSFSNAYQLKAWLPRTGCVAQVMITPPTEASSGSGTSMLLNAAFSKPAIIRVISPPQTDEGTYEIEVRLLVYAPGILSVGNVSALYLYKFHTLKREFQLLGSVPISTSSGYGEMVDLLVHHDEVYCLWNNEDKATVRTLSLHQFPLPSTSSQQVDLVWQNISYPSRNVNELDAVEIDRVLGSQDVSTSAILLRLLRPGFLSQASIEEALHQYIQAAVALPQPPPLSITRSYSSLSEQIAAVVGCTVHMSADSDTGALRRQDYQAALRRDWEGFVARCLAVERGARLPLSLSISSSGSLTICERERLSVLVREEVHMSICDQLRSGKGDLSDVPLPLVLGWRLREQLSLQNCDIIQEYLPTHTLDNQPFTLLDALHQMSLRFIQTLSLQSQSCLRVHEKERATHNEIESLCTASRLLLQVSSPIKQEAQPQRESESFEINRSFIAAASAMSIEARYELAQSLALYLLAIGCELPSTYSQSLWMSFGAFKSLAFLMSLTFTPDIHHNSYLSSETSSNLDVSAGLEALHLSTPPRQGLNHEFQSTLRCLILPPNKYSDLYDAAQGSLEYTGLFNTSFPIHLLPSHLQFCSTMRHLGFLNFALDYLALFSSAPGSQYLRGQLLIDHERFSSASQCFDSAAGHIELDLEWAEDRETFECILPAPGMIDSLFAYFYHIAAIFTSTGDHISIAKYTRLALDSAPPDAPHTETRLLWEQLIQAEIQLGMFEDAYAALIECPFADLKICQTNALVQAICENNATYLFSNLSFGGSMDDLESSLRDKARTADCLSQPFYSHILYSWYISKGDYRSAALTIYEYALKLKALTADGLRSIQVGRAESNAYLLAMNALSLLDGSNSWIIVPVAVAESSHTGHRRWKVRHLIPEDLFSEGCIDQEAIDFVGLQREFAIINAELELAQLEGRAFLRSSVYDEARVSGMNAELVYKYADNGRFNAAFNLAVILSMELGELFERFIEVCVALRKSESAPYHLQHLDWLHDLGIGASGTLCELAWQFLESSLDRYDSRTTGYAYRRIALEKILRDAGPASLPRFLTQFYKEQMPSELFGAYVKFGYFAEARVLSPTILSKKSNIHNMVVNVTTNTPSTMLEQLLGATDTNAHQVPI